MHEKMHMDTHTEKSAFNFMEPRVGSMMESRGWQTFFCKDQ